MVQKGKKRDWTGIECGVTEIANMYSTIICGRFEWLQCFWSQNQMHDCVIEIEWDKTILLVFLYANVLVQIKWPFRKINGF